MARPLRIEIPDGMYHVTSRGLERRAIVRDDADRRKWLDLLAAVATRRRWRVLAWVLMTNHYHLFLRTPDGDLSAGMHDLNAGYVTWFNRRHGRGGPLLQGRFKALLVESGAHEWELSRYIHLNPVRAGLVADPRRYPWGSCPDYAGRRAAPPWLACEDVLGQHGRTLRAARHAYERFLAEGVAAKPASPLAHAVASTLLGSPGFVARMREWLSGRLPDRDVPAARELRPRVALEAIERAVCEAFGVTVARLRERGRWGNDARAAALYLSRRLTARPVRELGECFGDVGGPQVSKSVARVAQRLRRDRSLARAVARAESLAAKKEKGKT